MTPQYEAAGDMADWPKNVPGKPTQAAVFGVYHPKKGKAFEVLWTGRFPDLQPAQYWAAKKEVEAVRKGKWMVASRVLWQHQLTPEQALEVVKKQMAPQVDYALKSFQSGGGLDIGPGPMRPVRPGANAQYVEVADRSGETLASLIIPPKDAGANPAEPDGPSGGSAPLGPPTE